MMMARDLTPQRPELDAASVEALTASLQRYVQEGVDGDLPAILRRVAAEARAKHMHAEHLLIALKDVWYSLPSVQQAPEGEEQARMLQRIITLSIRQYYG